VTPTIGLVTCIIPTWHRTENLPRVIASLRAQTVKPQVWIWDNGAGSDDPFKQDGLADVVFRSSFNFGCFARFPLMGLVRTPYIWQMDDDLELTMPNLIERFIELSRSLKDEFMIAPMGKSLAGGKEAYFKSTEEFGCETVMGNTGFTLFPTALANKIPMNPIYSERPISAEDLHFADDPWVCAHIRTYSAPWGREGIRDLPRSHGICKTPGDWPTRDRICNLYLRQKEAEVKARKRKGRTMGEAELKSLNYRETERVRENCLACAKKGNPCRVRPPGPWSSGHKCDEFEKHPKLERPRE
jgi:hypothetical protein